MSINSISLNPSLTEREHQLIAAWLLNPRGVAPQGWHETLAAFDRLRHSTVAWEGRRLTFVECFDPWVEERYATPFIEELLTLTALEPDGYRVLAAYARRVWQELAGPLADRPLALPERALMAHCLYWWNAFGKGYIFELMVFADLAAEGIAFHAHDLRRREERYSPDDLVILHWRGDVKTSTYFLYVARSFPLPHDFYITRLFVIETRTWLWAVLLTPAMWEALDGETRPAVLEEAGRLLPTVLEIHTRGGALVVVDYALWKAKIKVQQHTKEESTDGKDIG
jgi:hypothetical protein